MQQIKQLIADQVNTVLFEYFTNISKDQITTQLSKGQILLSNLQFKQDILKKFLLPLSIKESKINNISISFGTKYALQIDQVNLVIDVLNLYGKFVMESSIKLQILDAFKSQLLDNLLKGFTQQDKEKQQPQDPKKKMMMNVLQSLELDIKNINITFVDNYCTKQQFGIKLESLTCKASQDQKKIRNIEIINLQTFWQDTLLTLNCNSTLEDNSQDKQNALSFKVGVKVNELKCQISKVQTTQIVQFAFYVEQFIFKRENQIEEKTENDQEDKEEIRQILKEIALTENSISSEKYDRLQVLSQKQSIQDLKQIQFEIMKFDKGEEIVQLRKKKMGWFGGMVKYDKKMSDKIVNILEELEKDPSLNQQFLSKLEIQFDLMVNQFEIQLSSQYKGLDNILILSTQNANLQFIKKDDLQLDFSVLSSAVMLSYGGNSNYLFYKNEHFLDKNILEIHFYFNDQKENLNIQNSPFQIILNQQSFEQYYDFYYFVLLTQNHLPNIQKSAEQKLQQIGQNKKYKEINVKFEKIYILSTNGKETFLFSPGQLEFQYKTSDQNKYQIKIQDINFGFSEKIRSSIDFITEQYSMNSLIRNRDFKQITNCSIDIVIQLKKQELQTEINLDTIQMSINPQIYKYFYLFFETHYQQPFKEFLKQSMIGEDKKDITCCVSNKIVKKLLCLIVIKGNYLNVYEKEQNKKIFKIDLRNIPFRQSQNILTIAIQLEKEELFLEFEQQQDLDQITQKCLELRNDQFFMSHIQQKDQQKEENVLIPFQQKLKISLSQFQLIAEDNEKQMLACIELNGIQIQQISMENQSNLEINLVASEIFMNSRNQQDSQILYAICSQDTVQQSMIKYDYVLNGNQTVELNLPYIIFNYKFSAISKIFEFYPLHLNEEWSLTKFIINSYLTYYPDIQFCFNNLEVEVVLNQLIYRKSELKQILLKQNNEFKFRLFSDKTDQANLQLDGSINVCYKVINPKTSGVQINLNQFTALFTEQRIINKYNTSIKKKNRMERMILSPCKIGFELKLDFDSKTIKYDMNVIVDQLSITFGTQDILYFKEQIKRLIVQIEKFYDSYDLTQFLVYYRSKLFQIVATIENSIKVVLVDDFFNSQLPLFGGVLGKPKIIFSSDLDKLAFKVINNFEVWNYHQAKLVWEPLIESIGFFFDFRLTFQTHSIQLDCKVQKDCNINFSTELFKNIFKTQLIFNQFKGNTYKEKQPIPILKYNCYEIYNLSGLLVVGNSHGKSFQIENNRKISLNEKESLNFEIYTEQDTIRLFDWQIFTPKTKTFEAKGTTIIIETIIDEFMNSSKTFISSKVLVVNQTCHKLHLQFKTKQEIILLPLQKNILIDKTLQQPYLHILPTSQQKSSFQLIDKQNKSEFYDCKNVKQSQNLNTEFLQLEALSFRVKTVQDPLQNLRSVITIGPISVFKNQTPFSIILLIQGELKAQNQQIILMPNETHEFYDLSLIQNNVKYSFLVERFYESQKYTYSQLQTGLRFKLEDESWIQNFDNKTIGLNLLILSKPNNYGIHQIIVCYDYPYVINNTNFDLIIYQGTEKFQTIVSGQKYHTAQATLPLENIKDKNFFSFDFRNQNLKGETIKIEDFSSAISFYFCYKEINNSISYIPIQIEFKTKQWGDYSIQQVEIFLQYQIINKLETNIQLTQGFQKLLVSAGSQESIRIWDKNVLNQSEPKYMCNIEIQKQQQFQNIAFFNIYNYIQSIIQLQLNEGQQTIFVKISVFENSNQYYLVIEEETQNIPYMLINESKDLVIFLEDRNIQLNYKDRYSFAAKNIMEQDMNYKIRMSNEQQMMPVSFLVQCDAVGLHGIIDVGKKQYDYAVSQNKTQKIITFSDIDKKNQDNKQILKSGFGIDAAYNLEMKFAFDDNILISYIENQNIHTKELLLVKISDVKFDLLQQNEKMKVVFKLNRIQADSQSKLMSKHKNILQSEVQEIRNNLNFEFEILKFTKKSIHFNQITCNPGNFQLAIDQQFYQKSQQIQAQILEIQRTQIELFQNSLTQTGLHNLSLLDKQLKKRNKLKTVFVKKLILHPMDVKLSYYNDVYTVNRKHYLAEYIKSQPSKLIKKIITNYLKEGGAEQVLKTIGQFIQNKLQINQIKLNYFDPIRPKRALFSLQKIFKPYKSEDAKAWMQLKGLARTVNSNIKHMGFLGCFQVYQKGLELNLFIFEIMLFLHSNSTSLKEINYKSIQLCCQNNKFLLIEFYLNDGQEIQLSFTSDTQLQRAYSSIQRFLE